MNETSEPDALQRFRALVAQRLGLYFDDYKIGQLATLLEQRCAGLGNLTTPQYLALLEDGAESARELRCLAPKLTVAETYFMRNSASFEALVSEALPNRLAAAPGGLRMLSAGCASGEEAYSMAIAALALGTDPAAVRILGVDVNPAALDRARAARYSTWSLRQTPESLAERWFHRRGKEFELVDSVRRVVEFQEANLLDGEAAFWKPSAFDIVFCRNVLMYLTPGAAKAVVDRLTESLAPGGYLFLGDAETLRGLSHAFQLCHARDAFFYRKRSETFGPADMPAETTAPPVGQLDPSPGGNGMGGAHWRPPPAAMDAGWIEAIRESSDRIEQLSVRPAAVDQPVQTPRQELDAAARLLEQERYSDALELLGTLPPERGDDPEALLLQGVLLAHRNRLSDAEAVCRRLLARDDLNAGAHFLMALCREGAGDLATAAEHDEAAIYLDPGFAMPQLHLGRLARRSGELDRARRSLEQALELLAREDSSRILLFGGGFGRDALTQVCRAELRACGEGA
ncbi:MAG: methyltransferase domain-containing protein [Candidatus Wallbacteria bacterium]|nr:methyltransferase domain-containing protein [Candidatus Wallbacteria bacterium]